MTLLPARADIALGKSCHRCTARERCYRSPQTRAIAVGEAQNWMDVSPGPRGEPCAEWWGDMYSDEATLAYARGNVADFFKRADRVFGHRNDGEARYLTADQVDEHREAGFTVTQFDGHHGAAGYWLATKES